LANTNEKMKIRLIDGFQMTFQYVFIEYFFMLEINYVKDFVKVTRYDNMKFSMLKTGQPDLHKLRLFNFHPDIF